MGLFLRSTERPDAWVQDGGPGARWAQKGSGLAPESTTVSLMPVSMLMLDFHFALFPRGELLGHGISLGAALHILGVMVTEVK